MKPIFALLSSACLGILSAAPVALVEEAPVSITTTVPGITLVDFGKVSFGNIEIKPPAGASGDFKVHFGNTKKPGFSSKRFRSRIARNWVNSARRP